MKKSPMPWILILLTVLCVGAAGAGCIRAWGAFGDTREKLDSAQLAIQTHRDQIDELQKEQAARKKEERQKALDEQKAAKTKQESGLEEEAEEPAGEEAAGDSRENALLEESEEDASESSNGKVVGIDPGHQGSWVDMSALEPNAPGSSEMKARCTTGTAGNFTGLGEYQLNLDVSLKLKEILLARGYQVVMTREDNDANISNAERAQKMSAEGADICVRVHANSAADGSVKGALTMSPSESNPYVSDLYAESYRLSGEILDSYCEATGFSNRGIMLTDTMTGINWSEIPVTIVEMGFMSNENDDRTMSDSAFQQTMAEGIANGIDAYFGQ